MLARLALEPGRVVSVDALIDAMWGDTPPRTAKQSLHVHVSAIRDRLRPMGADHLIATTESGAYRLGLDGSCVDSHRFESEVNAGLQGLRRGHYVEANRLLTSALDRWSEPFPSLADYAPAIPERHRLEALREQASDARIDALLASARLDDALPLLRATVATQPLRERPYEQLIAVYSRIGDPVLARQVLVEATAVFKDALGIEPSSRLVDLATGAVAFEAVEVASSTAGSGPTLGVDLPGRWLVAAPAGLDPAALELPVSASTVVMRTRLAAEGDALGLSPVLAFAGLDSSINLADVTLHRNETFQRIARGLEKEGPAVLVIEGVHKAPPVLVDFLVWTLSRGEADATFSFVGIHEVDSTADAVQRLGPWCQSRLVEPVDYDVSADLPDDPDEAALLELIRHAVLPVPVSLIASASVLSAPAIQSALRRLSARGTIMDRPGGRIDLVGSRAKSDRDPSIDASIADTLARNFPAADPYRLVAEAHHRLHALPSGDVALAWQAALVAATQFDALDSYADLVALGRLAPPLGIDAPARSAPTEAELRFRSFVGRALIRLGDPVAGEALLHQVIEATDRPDVRAHAVRYLIERTTPQLQPESRDLVDETLQLLGPEPSDVKVQLISDLSGMWFLIDSDRSIELSEHCLATARALDRPDSIATALNGHVQALMLPGNASVRLELALESQQHARQANSVESLCLALTYEAQALIELGLLGRAEAPLTYATALADQIQVPRFCWWAHAWTALLGFARGEVDHAEEMFLAAHDRWPGSRDPVQCLGVQLATLWLFQERGGDLLPMLEHYDTEGTDAAIMSTKAYALAQSGHHDRSRTLVGRLLEPGRLDNVRDISLGFSLAMTAEAAHAVGHREAGAVLLSMIEPIADSHVALNVWGGGGCYWGSLRHALGLAQALAGDDRAKATLQSAAAANADAGAVAFALRSQSVAAAL